MKLLIRILAGVVGLIVVILALEMLASESGEVAVLTTTDASGTTQETRVWIVDHDGSTWLRSGSDGSGWFMRLVTNPAIAVERGDSTSTYHATPVPEARAEINRLMAEKYGWADSYIGVLFSRDDSVPIRLDPALD